MRFPRSRGIAAGTAALFIWTIAVPAFAASPAALPGERMSLLWALPFIGLLLSIATGPMLYPHFWERHYGKFAAFWGALALVPLAFWAGPSLATEAALHTLLLEYVPFIILLFALFTISGGILVGGNIHGSPLTNAGLLVIGAVLASFVGTTGASMIMIRPLLRANDNRPFNAHVVIFFIFLVSNIGGSLTPLGDPPLFVGFLRGVDFFWTTTHLFRETLTVGAIVLIIFVIIDWFFHAREKGMPKTSDPSPDSKVRLYGVINLPLLAGVIGAILLSAWWQPGISFTVYGVEIGLQGVARDVIMLTMAFLSLALSREEHHRANEFAWGPIVEVAVLFAAIFVCLVPLTAILYAGPDGALAPLVALVTHADGSANTAAYFWLTGALSSFLDNTPTYLVFFDLAGGNAQTLMTTGAATLVAISCGAVFMGANSYIGNAPNFMVYAIARHQRVRMPHFFGYMLWSGAILIPTYVFVTWLFFV